MSSLSVRDIFPSPRMMFSDRFPSIHFQFLLALHSGSQVVLKSGPTAFRLKAETPISLTAFTAFALKSEAEAKKKYEQRALHFSCVSAAVHSVCHRCVCLCRFLPPAGVLMSDSAHLGPA